MGNHLRPLRKANEPGQVNGNEERHESTRKRMGKRKGVKEKMTTAIRVRRKTWRSIRDSNVSSVEWPEN